MPRLFTLLVSVAASLPACGGDAADPGAEGSGVTPWFAAAPGMRAVTTVALSHRVMPGFDAPEAGPELPQGSVVDVLEGPVASVWYRVRHEDRTGWSHGGFLETLEPVAPTAILTGEVVTPSFTADEPRVDASTAALDVGTRVDIVGGPTSDGWILVRVAGEEAWTLSETVLPSFDQIAPPPAFPATATLEGGARATGNPALTMRDRPWGNPVAAVPSLLTVDVIDGPRDGWYAVRYFPTPTRFHEGWVWGDYLELVDGDHREVPRAIDERDYLPLAPGAAHFVIQGNLGSFSHQPGTLNEWAWDFSPNVDGLEEVDDRVLAAHDGTVRAVEYGNPTFGPVPNYVVLTRGDGTESLYLHLRQMSDQEDRPVRVGQTVQRGDLIGHMGDSGQSDGIHLHYQVQRTPPAPGYWFQQSIPSSFWDTGTPVAPLGDTWVRAGAPSPEVAPDAM